MVTVFSKSNCHPCKITKKVLTERGVEFEERLVDEDPEALAEIKKMGYLQVPVVVTPEDHWSGLNPDKLDSLVVSH